METAAGRLDELELRSKAGAQIIRQYSASVVMVQSAYGFRHTPTGRFLRQVLGEDGRPQMAANGLIMLSLDGTGAIAERQFIGTAFAVKGEGLFVTNRHVGYPWEQDAIIALRSDSGLEPVLLKLVAFIPGRKQAATVEVVAASQQDDLALLRLSQNGLAVDGPALADEVAQPGEEVIVLGYPTGLRSLLAQAGDEFIKTIQQSETTEFWNVARSLAEADKIAPLASRGIVGRVSEHNIVYDAETTHGGSGGPVFNIKGQVIAVNTAILPEFGGANLGIPAAKIQMLIDEAKN